MPPYYMHVVSPHPNATILHACCFVPPKCHHITCLLFCPTQMPPYYMPVVLSHPNATILHACCFVPPKCHHITCLLFCPTQMQPYYMPVVLSHPNATILHACCFVPPKCHHITCLLFCPTQMPPYYMPVVLSHPNATILHACCFVPPTECIPRLVSVIEHPESKQPENINATENAISAVVKICKYNGSKVNVDDIIPRLMHWLPVTEDVDEAVHIYNYICDLLEA